MHKMDLSAVLYIPKIRNSLISMSVPRKSWFRIIVIGDRKGQQKGTIELLHKPSGKVMLMVIETKKELYEATLRALIKNLSLVSSH